jgi:hypothetical protein
MKSKLNYQRVQVNSQAVVLENRGDGDVSIKALTDDDEKFLDSHNGADFCSCAVPVIPQAPQRFAADNCELCGSRNTVVYCSRVPVRYIRCRRCGFTFKTAR